MPDVRALHGRITSLETTRIRLERQLEQARDIAVQCQQEADQANTELAEAYAAIRSLTADLATYTGAVIDA